MDFRVFTEPQQGATYDDQLAVALAAERLGFSAFFRSDHLLAMSGDGLPGPTDAWMTLAALGRETSTIRLGTLVTSATFRQPGLLAIQVAQADRMSGGRIEFGLGTGWFAEEHQAYGIPFPPRRFGILEEQLEVITGLWSTPVGDTFGYEGEHYTLVNSPALPKPAQDRIPVVIGGQGRTRTPALAARFAAEHNVPFASLEDTIVAHQRTREACEKIGRPADDLIYSAARVVCVGADTSEVNRRAATIGREPDELRANGIAGTPEQAREQIAVLAEAGVERLYLQVLDLSDIEHLELIAAEVAGL